MRIFSKFHDYYDTALGYGIDPKIIYRRVEEQKQIRHLSARSIEVLGLKSEYPIVEKYFDRIRFYNPTMFRKFEIKEVFIIVFCGKLYGGLQIYIENVENVEDHFVYIYSIEELDELIEKYASKKQKEDYNRKKKQYFSNTRLSYKEFFEGITEGNNEELNEIHFDSGIPVIKFERSTIVFNPNLKELQFFKVFDPYAAFQELSMFIGGVMGGESPPMIKISDQVRAHKHGFDKTSFRKGPTSKRKKR